MPIAIERNSAIEHRIRSGFFHKMECFPSRNSPENSVAGGEHRNGATLSSSSTSSIGRNSDESFSTAGGGGGGSEGEEVQSEYKGGPLDSLEALEVALPAKRGISKFYSGKLKSFTNLGDATSCCSIEEIVKPEDPYTRKRKNLLTYNNFWIKNHGYILRSHSGGISKRPANSRSSLALASAVGLSESNSECSSSNSSSPVLGRPPLPPQSRRSSNNLSSASPQSQMFSPWRSLSLSDLEGSTAATPSNTGLFSNNEENSGESHSHSHHCQSPYESKFE